MEKLLKKIKKYLFMFVINNEISIIFEKHHLINEWYYIHITDDNKTAKLFITTSGVVTIEGEMSFKTIEIVNAINLICDSNYYNSIFEGSKRKIKMALEGDEL